MIPDADALWCMLQAFRLTLTELDQAINTGSQLLAAQTSRTVLAASTVDRYEHQLATLTRYRDQMREIVAHWGTMIEDFPPITESPREETHRNTRLAYTAIASRFLDGVRACKREARLAQSRGDRPETPAYG